MYFPGDPLPPLDPIFGARREGQAGLTPISTSSQSA
jgi:hypothetical protein